MDSSSKIPTKSSVIIRVKNEKSTFFVDCKPQDTIENIKKKLLEMAKIANVPHPSNVGDVRLLSGNLRPGTTGGSDPNSTYTILEDTVTLDAAKIVDDQVLFCTFKGNGAWPEVNVPKFADLGDEEA